MARQAALFAIAAALPHAVRGACAGSVSVPVLNGPARTMQVAVTGDSAAGVSVVSNYITMQHNTRACEWAAVVPPNSSGRAAESRRRILEPRLPLRPLQT